jgi:uncharacterized FlaG/YvyC family protein
MAVEDTERINASIEPVSDGTSEYASRRVKSDVKKESVSSPATSVEDGVVVEKPEPQGKGIQAANVSEKAAPAKSEALSPSKVKEIAEGINQELSFFTSSIRFEIKEAEDAESLVSGLKRDAENGVDAIRMSKKEIVVSVVDKRTGEVIRQIPPEDLLQSLNNASMFLGLLMDQVV